MLELTKSPDVKQPVPTDSVKSDGSLADRLFESFDSRLEETSRNGSQSDEKKKH